MIAGLLVYFSQKLTRLIKIIFSISPLHKIGARCRNQKFREKYKEVSLRSKKIYIIWPKNYTRVRLKSHATFEALFLFKPRAQNPSIHPTLMLSYMKNLICSKEKTRKKWAANSSGSKLWQCIFTFKKIWRGHVNNPVIRSISINGQSHFICHRRRVDGNSGLFQFSPQIAMNWVIVFWNE